jgi:hypothetical protein
MDRGSVGRLQSLGIAERVANDAQAMIDAASNSR